MKKILLALLFAPFLVQGQSNEADSLKYPNVLLPKSAEGKLEYSEVVTVADQKSDVLYSNAQQFILDVFEYPKEVIQLSDKESGKIVFKCLIKTPLHNVRCVGQIDIKDGRYRYTFRDFTSQLNFVKTDEPSIFNPERSKFESRKSWFGLAYPTDRDIKKLITLLKDRMSKSDKW